VSLRSRLTLGIAGVLTLAIAGAFFAAYVVVRNQLHEELDSALRGRARSFVRFGRATPRPPFGGIPRGTPPPLGEATGYLQFVHADGTTVLPSGEHVRLPTTGAQAVATGARGPFFSTATVSGTHLRIYTTRLAGNTALEIARPLTEIDHSLGRIRMLFDAIWLAVVLAAAAIGLFVSRAVLKPVRRLTEDAERIAATGDLRERTDQSRSDELGRLAVAFNTMLDALAQSVSAQRQLVADASHELRTPLATARTNLEVIELHGEMDAAERSRILAEAIDELREMTQLIEELVDLARGDVHVLETQPVRLDLVAEEAVAAAARRHDRRIDVALDETVVEGSPAALGRAISNLLDNAAKWSPSGTAIDVTVADGAVAVRDRGPGIAEEDLPHLFDRFYRAADARTLPGSGLGLAIVRQIAEAHRGTVSVEPADGGGSVFTLRLPPVPAPAPTAATEPEPVRA